MKGLGQDSMCIFMEGLEPRRMQLRSAAKVDRVLALVD